MLTIILPKHTVLWRASTASFGHQELACTYHTICETNDNFNSYRAPKLTRRWTRMVLRYSIRIGSFVESQSTRVPIISRVIVSPIFVATKTLWFQKYAYFRINLHWKIDNFSCWNHPLQFLNTRSENCPGGNIFVIFQCDMFSSQVFVCFKID